MLGGISPLSRSESMSPIYTSAMEEDVEVIICRLSEEWTGLWNSGELDKVVDLRSEERRVGKECRL